MGSGGRTYSIKDLENLCGIKAHTIRMWEKRYGILVPGRSDTNIRAYSEEEFKKLMSVALLNRNGLKISHIARLKDDELLREVVRLNQGENDRRNEVRHGDLLLRALRFDEIKFRKALMKLITPVGFEKAYIETLHPLIQKTRTLWLTDCISKSQEQFVMQILKDILASENAALAKPATKEYIAIINLNERESEINLAFLRLVLRRRRFGTIYPGGILTTDDIPAIHKIQPFSVLALNLPAAIPDNEVKDLCRSLIRNLRLKKVLILGRYESRGTWTDGKIQAACSPASLISWADKI